MGKILKFRTKVTRKQALQWLCENYSEWPSTPDHASNLSVVRGQELFHGWRFILGMNDSGEPQLYFANCIDRGICEAEFYTSQTVIEEQA